MLFIYLMGATISHIPSFRFLGYSIMLVVNFICFYLVFKHKMTIKSIHLFLFLFVFTANVSSLMVNFYIDSSFYFLAFVINFLTIIYLSKYSVVEHQIKSFVYVSLLLGSVPLFYIDGRGEVPLLSSIYGNPNTLANVLYLPLFLLFYFRPFFKRNLWCVFVFWFVLLLILTFSRSALLFLLVTFSVLFVANVLNVNLRLVKFVTIISLSFVFVAYWSLMSGDIFLLDIANQFLELSTKGGGLSTRDLLANLSIHGIQQHPFGVGLGKSSDYISSIIPNGLSPHNAYLKNGLEGGLLLLSSLLFFIFTSVYFSNNAVTLAFVTAVAVQSLFESFFLFGLSLYSLTLPFIVFLSSYSSPPYTYNKRSF